MDTLSKGSTFVTPKPGEPHEPDGEMPWQGEERCQAILQAAMDGFWMTDTQGRLLDVNAAYCRMSGYSKQELLAMSSADVEVCEGNEEIQRQQIINLGRLRFESQHRRKDGSLFDVEVSSVYWPAEGGRVVSFLRDITERKRAVDALRESEKRLRDVIDHTPAGYFFIDRTGRFQHVNDAWLRMHGYDSAQEVIGRHFSLTQIKPDEGAAQRNVEMLFSGESIPAGEFSRRCRDGSVGYHSFSARPVTRAGEVVGVEGFLIDITERKQAEEELRKLAAVARYSGELINLATLDGQMIFINEAGAKIIGVDQDHVDRVHILDVIPDCLKAKIEKELLPALMSRGTWKGELQARNLKTGQLTDMYATTFTINDPKTGEPLYLANVSMDITDRKRTEEALKKSEEKFFKAFKVSPESISIASMEDGTFIEVNDSFLKTTGFQRDEVIGRTSVQVGVWVDRNDRRRFVEELSSNGILRGYAAQFRMRSGEIRDFLVSSELIELEGKQCSLNFMADITERKRAEREKAELQAQLQQAQKLESVGRLAGGVAHDFNNMLNVILGYTELAMTKVSPADSLYADLEEIITAAERSAKITRQLLAFARKQIVAPKVLDLNETVTSMHKMLERIIGEQIHLEWQPAPNLWLVKVDPSQIDQILANLCVNARDAISGMGKITIATGNCILDAQYCGAHPGIVPGAYVRLSVSDDGCGMDQETLDHIFEPFFTTKGVGKGTGLGLATVYGAIQQNNGLITAESALGKGTTFTIYLPRHVGESGRVRMNGGAEASIGGKETILLVEDEPAVLALTTKMLEKQGYKVLSTKSPDQAVDLAREHIDQIQLLVTDVIMPGMNGRDLWHRLCVLRPDLKCLYMSGYPDNAIAHHGVLEKGAHFIQKPFVGKELAARVRAAIETQ